MVREGDLAGIVGSAGDVVLLDVVAGSLAAFAGAVSWDGIVGDRWVRSII